MLPADTTMKTFCGVERAQSTRQLTTKKTRITYTTILLVDRQKLMVWRRAPRDMNDGNSKPELHQHRQETILQRIKKTRLWRDTKITSTRR